MQKFAHTVLDREGRPVQGANVYLYLEGTATLAATFQDDEATALPQPLTTDERGFVQCKIDNGAYDVKVYIGSELQRAINGVYLFGGADAVTGGFGAMTDIASGSTVDLGSITSTFANITGTTTINSFGTSASTDKPIYLVRFAGALTLTHSSALVLPASVNLTTAAGDYSIWQYLGGGIGWRLVEYYRAGLLPAEFNPATGALAIPATASADSSLVLQERTGSGGQTATLIAANGLTANRTFTLGDNGGVVVTDTSLRTELNATGSAPIYAARAWVNFNGTGTVAIRASGNVSSITDNGTGIYTVNFTTSMPDANYAAGIVSNQIQNAIRSSSVWGGSNPNTSGLDIVIRNGGGTNTDPEYCMVTIHR